MLQGEIATRRERPFLSNHHIAFDQSIPDSNVLGLTVKPNLHVTATIPLIVKVLVAETGLNKNFV